MEIAIIGFVLVIVLVFLRVPIGFAMGLVGVIGFAALNNWNWRSTLGPAASDVWETVQKDDLSVIPLFIFMGMLIARSGMAHDLYQAGYVVVGRFRGGLAMSTILACGGFSAISGSSLATAATMTEVAMPPMRKFGYSDSLSTASIAAGGTLGILIPPSIILVIYGYLTSQSVGKLFLAGILPGLLGLSLYLCAVIYTVRRDPKAGPAGKAVEWKQIWISTVRVVPIIILFGIIFGGIYARIYSADEAASVGAVGAVVLSIVFRRFTIKGFVGAVKSSIITSTTLFTILIGATIFTRFIVRSNLPDELLNCIVSMHLSPMSVVFMIVLIYLILGAVFESLSMITLTVPIFAPLIVGLHLFPTPEESLIWFGIIVVVVTEISLITPPIGLNVFVLRGLLPDIKTATIFKGVTPFWVADIVRLLILILIPAISLFLPLGMT